jgi:hypothetical protein
VFSNDDSEVKLSKKGHFFNESPQADESYQFDRVVNDTFAQNEFQLYTSVVKPKLMRILQ